MHAQAAYTSSAWLLGISSKTDVRYRNSTRKSNLILYGILVLVAREIPGREVQKTMNSFWQKCIPVITDGLHMLYSVSNGLQFNTSEESRYTTFLVKVPSWPSSCPSLLLHGWQPVA